MLPCVMGAAAVTARQEWRERRPWLMLGIGVVAPLFCLVADPAVIHNGYLFEPWIRPAWARVFLVTQFACMAVATCAAVWWLPRRGGALVGGVLWSGSIVAAVFGCVLLPLVLLGMFFMIGVLGLLPLFVAGVYWKLGRRVLALAPGPATAVRKRAVAGFATGLLIPALSACIVAPRADAALAAMWRAPTPALRFELRVYQTMFNLYTVANALQAGLPDAEIERFESLRQELGIPLLNVD